MDIKTKEFIKKSKKYHGERYDYSETIYVHSMQKLKIRCTIHGIFELTPNNHLSGRQGCQKCSGKYKPNTEEFIKKAREVHGSKYEYVHTKYGKNNRTKVIVGCSTHGEFQITPANHISGKEGCPECAKKKYGAYHKKNTTQFIKESKIIHAGKYDYSLVEYTGTHDKVKIICNIHGTFNQRPSSHLRGVGCPKCSHIDYCGGYGKKRFINHPEIKNNPAILYLIYVTDETENFLKIGITEKDLNTRFIKNNKLPYTFTTKIIIEGKLYELYELEQRIKHKYKKYKYIPNKKFNGYTECFATKCADMLCEELK